MRVNLKGQELHLRGLTDPEWDEANALARLLGSPLDNCPTCGTLVNYTPAPNEVEPERKYRFRGQAFDCDCKAQAALFARYLIAHIPDEYMRLDWADYDGSEQAREFVAEYLGNWVNFKKHGYGLEFGGVQMGIGKTFAATHIGKELVKQKQRVYYIPFVEMVSAFEKENGHDIEEQIRMTPFVILDDIMPPVSEKQGVFYHTRLEAILRHRTNYNLPTIITTNLTTKQLEEYYPRTYSLLAAKQLRINMVGDDARAGKVQKENMEFIANGEVRPIT